MRLDRYETARFIVETDPAFGPVVDAVGPPPARRPEPVAERFASLCESVTHQLLALKAARTIHGRVVDACGGEVTPDTVLSVGPEALRACGLSTTKARALIEVATATHDGRLDFTRHGRMSDEAVTREITDLHGLGQWTAQMYLLFTLARPDVWSPADLGVRHGWSLIHGLDERIDERELARRGEDFAGVRSAVAWYCWRTVDLSREQ